jgi:type IV pilus assembly protein PilA
MKNNKGFTLIELLVVIAIIGILSSIVIASLNSARSRGKDAAIRSQMAQLRTQAEIFFDANGGSFGTASSTSDNCSTFSAAGSVFATTSIQAQLVQIAGNDAPNSKLACIATPFAWAMSISGLSGNTASLCIDNSGNIRSGSAPLTTGICS